MKRALYTLFVAVLFLIFIGFFLIYECGCSGKPEQTLSYKNFLDEGIDKFTKGQYKEAIPPLLKAEKMNPREGMVHFWLFQAYTNLETLETNDFKQSKTYIEAQNVIALMPGTPQAQQAKEYFNKKNGNGLYSIDGSSTNGVGWKAGVKAALERGMAREATQKAPTPSSQGKGIILVPNQNKEQKNDIDGFIKKAEQKDAESCGVKYR